jgi:hypothetical protein
LPARNTAVSPESDRYVGSLIFDDIVFSRLIFAVLRNPHGRSTGQIGDPDPSRTLEKLSLPAFSSMRA